MDCIALSCWRREALGLSRRSLSVIEPCQESSRSICTLCTGYSLLFFFFSSRRRHTRFDCDWSSDVCSSDLDAVNDKISDEDILRIEENACPTCGSCSGMFTANSMNCLTEAIGLSLPGNGSEIGRASCRERV